MNERENRQLLDRFEAELAVAEEEAKQALTKVESLRRVVRGLRGYLGIEEPVSAAELNLRLRNAGRVEGLRRARDERQARPSTTSADRGIPQAQIPDGNAPRGRDAVRQILIDSRRQMHIDEIVKEALDRGWMGDVSNPKNALYAATKRLEADGELENRGRATYRYRLDKLPAPVAEGSR